MNKILSIGISIAVVAALVGFLVLPVETRQQITGDITQISDQTRQLLNGYCSGSLDVPREYLVELIRKQFPDYPEHGICGLYQEHERAMLNQSTV